MFSIANLLERAKQNAHLETDYRLSKVLSINQSAIGNYRAGRSWPNDKILSQLCALSGDDVALVAAQVQAERSQSDEGRAMWRLVVARLSGAASTALLSVLFAIVFVAGHAGQAQAATVQCVHNVCVKSLYIVSNAFLSVPVFLLVRLRWCCMARMRPVWCLSLAFAHG